MYPTRELNHLSSQKARLQRKIIINRNHLVQDVSRVVQPLTILQPFLAVLQAASPLVAQVLGMFIRRTIFPRIRKLCSLLSWSSLLAGILHMLLLSVSK